MSAGRFLYSMLSRNKPRAGEIWMLHRDSGPWPKKGGGEVIILDFKKGWVRYKFKDSTMWQDERMKWGDFLYCYDRISP